MIKMSMAFVLTAFFITTSAYAQYALSAENIVAEIQIELNLNQEQLDKVILIIEENMVKRQEITPHLSQGLTQKQSLPLDAELYSKLSGVLTRPQMSHWVKIRELMLEKPSSGFNK